MGETKSKLVKEDNPDYKVCMMMMITISENYYLLPDRIIYDYGSSYKEGRKKLK